MVATAVLMMAFAIAASSEAQQAGSQRLPSVWVIATGGTIAGRGDSSGASVYKPGVLTADELVKSVPEITQYADVKVEQLFNVASTDVTLENVVALSRRINTIFANDPMVAGIVVTHGTNTLEETAYFLNLTVRDDRPVVVTGAMRPATSTSADGPLNLVNAIRTAATREARGKGVLVVLNDEINSARDATKTSTYRLETFRAPDLGLLGYVDRDAVVFYRASTRRHTSRTEFDVMQVRELPKVDIYYSYMSPNTEMIGALVRGGAKGIVFAGTGAGSVTTAERAALKALQSSPTNPRPVLVRSSRVGSGRVIGLSSVSEEYDALGVIPGDNLNPQKARLLLMLALTKTDKLEEIKRMFAEY
jgi:L-asparaginase type II